MRVVLSSTALLSFMSVRKAAALAIAQLGIAVFFLAGTAVPTLGPSAVWFAAGALLLAALVRAIDIESWALFIPGGLVGRVRLAFGPRAATVAATASLTERLLFVALASILVGHYASGATLTAIAGLRLTGHARPEDVATVVAALLIGFVWIRARQGLDFASDRIAQGIWIGVAVVGAVIGLAAFASVRGNVPPLEWASRPPLTNVTGWFWVNAC